MRGAETPVVPDKFFAGPVVLNVSRELERFARAFRRGDELNELARFAPKIFFAAPLDVFQSAGGPVSDGSENRGRRGTTIGFPKIDDDGLARRQPLQVVSGNGEAGRLNVFAESEERVMALEIFDRRFVALIDFDLLHARIALDVEDAVAREQVGIEFLGAADVEDRVGFAIELADPGERKTGSGIAGQIARAKTPASPKAELAGEMPEKARRVIEFVVYLECLGVIGKPGGILNVEDIVAEASQSDDVVKVLPDHAGDRATAHEAHDDEALFFHCDKSRVELLCDYGRISGDDDICGDAFRDDGAGGDDGILADRYPFQNHGVHADPDVVGNDDRGGADFRAWRPVLEERGEGVRVGDSLSRRKGMKIGISNADIPRDKAMRPDLN